VTALEFRPTSFLITLDVSIKSQLSAVCLSVSLITPAPRDELTVELLSKRKPKQKASAL
jgi:hypothetical protein